MGYSGYEHGVLWVLTSADRAVHLLASVRLRSDDTFADARADTAVDARTDACAFALADARADHRRAGRCAAVGCAPP
jgi:hypothetical protein